MNAPKLNRNITLEELSRSPDGAGGFVEVWVAKGNLWAEIRAVSGREGETDHAKLSETAYRITIRSAPHGADSRPKPDQRFVEGPRIFRIRAVNETDIAGRYLECLAIEEIVA